MFGSLPNSLSIRLSGSRVLATPTPFSFTFLFLLLPSVNAACTKNSYNAAAASCTPSPLSKRPTLSTPIILVITCVALFVLILGLVFTFLGVRKLRARTKRKAHRRRTAVFKEMYLDGVPQPWQQQSWQQQRQKQEFSASAQSLPTSFSMPKLTPTMTTMSEVRGLRYPGKAYMV
ncbi:hypothetical protein BJV78DRAFT_1256485 [Lactifluus subvellereus]|nr:hypothetical protein BJV78DRAFT_1256485 [Lactifluus subvellereus]